MPKITFSTRKTGHSPLRFLQEKDIMHRFNVIFVAALAAAGQAALWSQTQSHSEATKISANLVSFYEVPLACPAARGLGCGSAAKPVLQALEKRSSIQEAWLDHPGTTLAIVWRKDPKSDSCAAEIQSVADDRGIALHEITGERRDDTLKTFASRKGWYRGSEVDRLSEEEAGVIVDRLVRRAMVTEPTIGGKTNSLKPALLKVIPHQLPPCTSPHCPEACLKRFTEVARQQMNDPGFLAPIDAQEKGDRPV